MTARRSFATLLASDAVVAIDPRPGDSSPLRDCSLPINSHRLLSGASRVDNLAEVNSARLLSIPSRSDGRGQALVTPTEENDGKGDCQEFGRIDKSRLFG